MNKVLISAIAVASAVLANAASAQIENTVLFAGLSVGKAKYRAERNAVSALEAANLRGVGIDDESTAFKLTVGAERDNLIGGLDYTHWGEFDGRTSGGAFSVSATSFAPWVGYKIGGAYSDYPLHLVPKIGYAFVNADDRVQGVKITDAADGVFYGISLDFDIGGGTVLTVGYDRLETLGLASIGMRYRFD